MEIQLQMHKIAPFLRVQLDQDSNAQFMEVEIVRYHCNKK
jgi:hypothetical protein